MGFDANELPEPALRVDWRGGTAAAHFGEERVVDRPPGLRSTVVVDQRIVRNPVQRIGGARNRTMPVL